MVNSMGTSVKIVTSCTKCRKSDLVDTRSNFCYRCKSTVTPIKPTTSPQVLEYMALSAVNQRNNNPIRLFRVIVGAFIGALSTTTIVVVSYLLFQFLNNNLLFNMADILGIIVGSFLFGSLVGAGIGYSLNTEKAD